MKPQSKVFLFTISFIFFISISSFGQNHKMLLLMGDDNEKETTEYKNRVTTDNGTIQSLSYLDNFIKKSKNNFYDNIKFWVNVRWGLKTDSNKVLKLYDLKSNDLIPLHKSYPVLNPSSLFGFDGIYFKGKKQYLFNDSMQANHPLTMILVFQQDGNSNHECMLDSKNKKSHSVLFDDNHSDPAPLSLDLGKKIELGMIDENKSFLYFELNGNNSTVYKNGNILFQGKIPSGEFNGIFVGRSKKNSDELFFDGYLFEIGIIEKLLTDEQKSSLIDFIKQSYSIN